MFDTAQKDNENYSLKYSKNLEYLSRKRGLSEEIVDQAVELTDSMMASHRQHYEPRYVAAASLHLACRQNNIPSTAKDFASFLEDAEVLDSCEETGVWRAVKALRKINDVSVAPLLAEAFVPLISERVGLDQDVRDVAEDIVSRIQEERLSAGRSQIGMAGVSAYLAAQKLRESDVSVERFAEAASRDPNTLLGNARTVKAELDIDFE